eukprot:1160510-Pelagomonas_calceolata.AAC.8
MTRNGPCAHSECAQKHDYSIRQRALSRVRTKAHSLLGGRGKARGRAVQNSSRSSKTSREGVCLSIDPLRGGAWDWKVGSCQLIGKLDPDNCGFGSPFKGPLPSKTPLPGVRDNHHNRLQAGSTIHSASTFGREGTPREFTHKSSWKLTARLSQEDPVLGGKSSKKQYRATQSRKQHRAEGNTKQHEAEVSMALTPLAQQQILQMLVRQQLESAHILQS